MAPAFADEGGGGGLAGIWALFELDDELEEFATSTLVPSGVLPSSMLRLLISMDSVSSAAALDAE
jgi:hypothetical protein